MDAPVYIFNENVDVPVDIFNEKMGVSSFYRIPQMETQK